MPLIHHPLSPGTIARNEATAAHPWAFRDLVLAASATIDLSASGLSVQRHNGTITGTVTSAANYWDFSGDGDNDYIDFPTTTSTIFMLTTPVTIACWAKNEASTSLKVLVEVGRDFHPFNLHTRNTGTDVRFERSNLQDNVESTGAQFTSTSPWRHIVGTYDGTNLELYVDGVSQGTAASTTSLAVAPEAAKTTVIGRGYPLSSWSSFNGKIDDVLIYTRAFTANEVKKLYLLPRGEWARKKPTFITGTPPAGDTANNLTLLGVG